MSPLLPPDEVHWAPAATAYWSRLFGTNDLSEILLRLQSDYPANTYRLHDGALEVLVTEYDEEE